MNFDDEIRALARKRAEAFRRSPEGMPRRPPPSEPEAFRIRFGHVPNAEQWRLYVGAWTASRAREGSGRNVVALDTERPDKGMSAYVRRCVFGDD